MAESVDDRYFVIKSGESGWSKFQMVIVKHGSRTALLLLCGLAQLAMTSKGLARTGNDFNTLRVSQIAPPATLAPPGGQPNDPQPTRLPFGTGVKLTKATTPIVTSQTGQVIENLDIYVDSGNAIQVSHDNVIIRNVRVHHKDGDGINVNNAKNVQILNSEIINADPPRGQVPETNESIINIEAFNAHSLTIRSVTVREGSSGIYLLESPNATLSHVDGYNFHGPFPRGQFVQFNNSGNSTLTDFYVYNDRYNSHPEDNVSVYASPNVRIANGVIDGNNSVTGVGVMFEHGSTGGRVTNVDAIHMGNGAFSSYNDNVVFEGTRSFDSIHADQGRGMSASNGLQWNHSGTGIKILNSTYTRPGNPGNIAWGESPAAVKRIREDARAKPMMPITNRHGW